MPTPVDSHLQQARIEQWKAKLANLTELVLPTDYPRQIPHRIVEAETSLDISDETSRAILQLSMAQESMPSPFSILLSAFAVLLHKYTNEFDISVGSSCSSSNPCVLRMSVTDQDTLLHVIENVTKTEQEAASNEVPFNNLLNAMFSPSAKEEFQPSLFKVRFFNMTDTTTETIFAASGSTCDLTIFISQSRTLRRLLPINIRVGYNSLIFSQLRIRDMLDQLELVLVTAAKNMHCPIGEISLVTARNKTILPDPTSDLHWDDYQGAITDIFSANAQKHPLAVCVVESLDHAGFDRLRTFNYRQINEASNVIAHSLIRNGIGREDVVVLFSHRSVDLVVAVMGVLKAGATFSVIDPAYPPARQNIYLSVAKPRGLVILKKAGELPPDVRAYVSEKLSIKFEIPALELLDDGSLKGGMDQGQDCLQSDQKLASQHPGIVIGPDSIGTLSFTSGSTGIPKGVRGRHFSLTHFYPWMKQEFGLSEQERFTMLSGIAHDPIQRDIFTPLYLGAQLHIPTAEDIGSPGRLAQWMDDHKITITHLTPAMGQLLSANATHFIPSLRNAFFVGDVLTKRDVNRLQYLAPNCYIVNMYGTTETQRAVSYLKIPPSSVNLGFLSEQKDIMPAGKGMKNVQLLVVNPHGVLCGVGEVGEIFVRSSGLAEGYLELEEVTKMKFLQNSFQCEVPKSTKSLEFFKGPRDRMYRTGDLGRYQPNDQVKIRGFRIELGEIDTHLSQHPAIRENVTLVRRDKDEEQTLVSYFVPFNPPTDLSHLLKDIREYLKLKLPSYAVPSVFVPLTRMPLTPNGKVDKNNLPFPDTVLSMATSGKEGEGEEAGSLTPSEQAIRDIWSSLLGIPSSSISIDEKFFDIGGHSVLATRLIFSIRTKLSVVLPLGTVYREPTVRGIAREVDRIRSDDFNLVNEDDTKSHKSYRDETSTEEEEDMIEYAVEVAKLDRPDMFTADRFKDFNLPDPNRARFFLTGATGFLGAFILSALLKRFPDSTVVCHVRAKASEEALLRVQENSQKYLVWDEQWKNRVQVVCGDLGKSQLGLSSQDWADLCHTVDIVVHNGALVHWVYPFEKLLAPNVCGTVEILKLCSTDRMKPLHFVSSTSVLDTRHYSKKIGREGDSGKVLETDNLEGSRRGLRSGYAQSKWVAEKLIMNAKSRGVPATIIRPGYIVGDTMNGAGNGDDFLWRLAKGCKRYPKDPRVPRISNIINMCPVDYVASLVAAVCANGNAFARPVYHAWHPHQFKFQDLFDAIAKHYRVELVEYVHWRTCLMEMTMNLSDHALYPLLHFVLDDLPTSTRSPELSDRQAVAICKKDETLVRTSGMGGSLLWSCPDVADFVDLYLGFLAHVEFLPAPELKSLPGKEDWKRIPKDAVGGRTRN